MPPLSRAARIDDAPRVTPITSQGDTLMKTIVARALWGTLIAGGITLLGATAAQAAETTGEDGLLSGTQALISLDAPITVAGNAISLLGDSETTDAAASAPAPAAAPDAVTSGADGIASGTQGLISVNLPITVGGNGISLIGDSSSSGAETAVPAAEVPAPEAPVAEAPVAEAPGGQAPVSTSGSDGILSGTQGIVDLDVPVTVGGNAISVIGDSESTGAVTTPPASGGDAGAGEATTDGSDGILGGTQVIAPIDVPVTVGGNAISVIGDTTSTGAITTPATGNGTGTAGAGEATTDGADSILGGAQVIAPIDVPVTVGGNAISLIGDSTSTDATVSTPAAGDTGDATTSGSDGILGGIQVLLPVTAPITIGGNAVSVIGDSETTAPIVPAVPADPTEPGSPTDPTDPGTPTDPTDPTTPVDPTDPTDPTTPVDPADPTDPTTPVDPTDPGTPTDPTEPGTPGTPDESGMIGEPAGMTGTPAAVTGVTAAGVPSSALADTGGSLALAPAIGAMLTLALGALLTVRRRRVA
jgi:hypothetical protein